MSETRSAIRLLLSDVDGTLVTSDKRLTDSAVHAVRKLRDAGILFAIASGRPPGGLEAIIDRLAVDTPSAAFNGGLMVDHDLTVLFETAVPKHVVTPICALIASYGLDVWLYRESDWWVTDPNGPYVAHEAQTVNMQPRVIPCVTGVEGARNVEAAVALVKGVIKIVGVGDDRAAMAAATDAIRARYGTFVSAASSQPYYLDVTQTRANKGTVVHALAKRYALAADEIATIGDMPTDMLMFAQSGFSVAMGNADPQVRQAAHAITDTNDNDGFAQAVERFILPHHVR